MQLHFKVFGEGDPLFILHGLLGSLDNWQSLAKKYAENFTVFIIDQRNHGKSPHSDEFSYQILSDDLLEFCSQQSIYKTHILGHSMGGKTAMHFAQENADYVDKLIIADIAPIKYKAGHTEIFKALMSVDLNSIASRKEVDTHLSNFIPEFGVRQFLMKGLTRGEDKKFVWKFNLDGLWNNYDKILDNSLVDDSYTGETLFIKGEKSKYIQDQYRETISAYFSNYHIDSIPKVGHWLHAENPNAFYSKSLKFLLS